VIVVPPDALCDSFGFRAQLDHFDRYPEHLLGSLHLVVTALNLDADRFFQPLHVLLGLRQLRFALTHDSASFAKIEHVVIERQAECAEVMHKERHAFLI